MHQKEIITSGKKLTEAKKALIMLHGRGASAEDILRLTSYLNIEEFAIVAPQATNNTGILFLSGATRQMNSWLSFALST